VNLERKRTGMNRNSRIIGLVFALVIVVTAAAGLFFVSKIVAIGGPSYRWEYIPSAISLSLGIALTAFWVWRIAATRKP